jgi:DNA repair protein RadA/Sms
VLSRHAGVTLGNRDVYVNVAGGIKLSETATDVAIALAVLSSYFDKPLPAGTVCFGEIGLSGEIRPVQRGQERLKEAKKLGFRKAIIPQANQATQGTEKLEVVPIKNVGELLELLH